jgi:hypothetical protein
LWANFWGKPGADWRIKAGLSTNLMQVLRQMACKQVVAGDHSTALVLTNVAENAYFYQAYVGRVAVTTNPTTSVFLDDEAIATGTTTPLVGNTVRTWYDGVSYAKVESLRITAINRNPDASISLSWNSIPTEHSLTTPSYTVQRKHTLSDANWATLASQLPSAGATTIFTDTSATNGAAFYRITSP